MGHLRTEDIERLWATATEAVATTGLKLLLIVAIYWAARQTLFRLIDATLARLHSSARSITADEERAKRLRTLQTLARSFVGYVLFFVLTLTVLRALGVDITGIITTAGVAGVAVGFGSQKLVRDIITGVFIVTEDQFAVGDYVTVGQASGIVEEMALRTTRIRDDSGRLWAISNGDISVVVNHSRGAVSAMLDLTIPSSADPDAVTKLIADAGPEILKDLSGILVGPPVTEGVVAFDAASFTLRLRYQANPAVMHEAEIALRTRLRSYLIEREILPKPGA